MALYSYKYVPKCPTQGSQPGLPVQGLVQAVTFLPKQHFLKTMGCVPGDLQTPFPKAGFLYLLRNLQKLTPISGRRYLSNKAPNGHV